MGCALSSPKIEAAKGKEQNMMSAKVTPGLVVESLDDDDILNEAARKRTPVAADVESRVVRGARNGRVLRKQTVLKADHYPSSHNSKLPEHLEGAPNFRQPSDKMPVFGTAAPTQDGLRAVCARVAPSKQPIVWCNLRQEPCVYIHGRPFSVKERDAPFKAMENKGIQISDVEQAEVLLKLEVIDEARANGGRLLVLDESVPGEAGALCAKGELYSYWELNVSGATVSRRHAEEPHEGIASEIASYNRLLITSNCIESLHPPSAVCTVGVLRQVWTPREMHELVRLQVRGRFRWLLMASDGLASEGANGFRRLPTASAGFRRLPPASDGFRRLPTASAGFRRLPTASDGVQSLSWRLPASCLPLRTACAPLQTAVPLQTASPLQYHSSPTISHDVAADGRATAVPPSAHHGRAGAARARLRCPRAPDARRTLTAPFHVTFHG